MKLSIVDLSLDDAVQVLGGLPPLECYGPGSGTPPRFLGGTAEQVGEQLHHLARDLAEKETMIQDLITDFEARLRSCELLAGLIVWTSRREETMGTFLTPGSIGPLATPAGPHPRTTRKARQDNQKSTQGPVTKS